MPLISPRDEEPGGFATRHTSAGASYRHSGRETPANDDSELGYVKEISEVSAFGESEGAATLVDLAAPVTLQPQSASDSPGYASDTSAISGNPERRSSGGSPPRYSGSMRRLARSPSAPQLLLRYKTRYSWAPSGRSPGAAHRRLKRAASLRQMQLSNGGSLALGVAATSPSQLAMVRAGHGRATALRSPGSPPGRGSSPHEMPAGAFDFVAVGTLAGAGRPGYRDGGLAQALFDEPGDMCPLPGGAVLVADRRNSCLRVVRLDSEEPASGAGGGSRTGPNAEPSETKSDIRGKYYRQYQQERRRRAQQRGPKPGLRVAAGAVVTLDSCSLLRPRAPVLADRGRVVMVCDSGHHKIRLLQLQGGGSDSDGKEGVCWAAGSPSLTVHDSILAGTGRRGYRDGPADRAEFSSPSGLCVLPDGSVLVADTGNSCIRRIAGRPGRGGLFVATVAGVPTPAQERPGEGVVGQATPMPEARSGQESEYGVAGGGDADARDSLFRTAGEHAGGGLATTGEAADRAVHWRDGHGDDALFRRPEGLVFDPVSGLVIVADTGNHCLRALLPPRADAGSDIPGRQAISKGALMATAGAYEVTTVAGSPGVQGHTDGPGPSARFSRPRQLAMASDGAVLVADSGNGRVRAVVQSSQSAFGEVMTVSGGGGRGKEERYRDGAVRSARFASPSGLCVLPGSGGCVVISDAYNNHLRVMISRGAAQRPPRTVRRAIPSVVGKTGSTQTASKGGTREPSGAEGVVDALRSMARGAGNGVADGSNPQGSAVAALLACSSPGRTLQMGEYSFRRGGGAGGGAAAGGTSEGVWARGPLQITFGLGDSEAELDVVGRLQASVRAIAGDKAGAQVQRHVVSSGQHQLQYQYEADGGLLAQHGSFARQLEAIHRAGRGSGRRGAPAALQSAALLDRLGASAGGKAVRMPGYPRVVMSSHARPHSKTPALGVRRRGDVGVQAGSRATAVPTAIGAARGDAGGRAKPRKQTPTLLASSRLAQITAGRLGREKPSGGVNGDGRPVKVVFGRTAPLPDARASGRSARKPPPAVRQPDPTSIFAPYAGQSRGNAARVTASASYVAPGDVLISRADCFVEANSPPARMIRRAQSMGQEETASEDGGAALGATAAVASMDRTVGTPPPPPPPPLATNLSLLRMDAEGAEGELLAMAEEAAGEVGRSRNAQSEDREAAVEASRGSPGAQEIRRTKVNLRALCEDAGEGGLKASLEPQGDGEAQAGGPFAYSSLSSESGSDCVSRIVEDAIAGVLQAAGAVTGQEEELTRARADEQLQARLLDLYLAPGVAAEASSLLQRCRLVGTWGPEVGQSTGGGEQVATVPQLSEVTRLLRRAAQLDEVVVTPSDGGGFTRGKGAEEGPQWSEGAPAVAGIAAGRPPLHQPLSGVEAQPESGGIDEVLTGRDRRPAQLAGKGGHGEHATSARRKLPPASADSSELSWSLASDSADPASQETTRPASGMPRYLQPTVSAVQRARSSGVRMRPDSLSYGWRARHKGAASWVEASEAQALRAAGRGPMGTAVGHSPEALHHLAVRRLEASRGPGGEALPDTTGSGTVRFTGSGRRPTRRSAEVARRTRRAGQQASQGPRALEQESRGGEGIGLSLLGIRPALAEGYVLALEAGAGAQRGSGGSGHVPVAHDGRAWIQEPPLDLEVSTTPAFATRRGGGRLPIEDFVERPRGAGGHRPRRAPVGAQDNEARRRFVQSHAAVQSHHPAMQLRPSEAAMRESVASAAVETAIGVGVSGRGSTMPGNRAVSPLRQVSSLPAYSVPVPGGWGAGPAPGRRVQFAP